MGKKKNKPPYSSRTYLNPEGHPSTGDVYSFCGGYEGDTDGKDRNVFLSISDCHCKVRLHPYGLTEQDRKDYITKLATLEYEVAKFRQALIMRWKV